jgi:hypothetical protein
VSKLGRYVKRVLIAGDQFLNALTGGREDETISSREGRYDRTQPKTGAPTLTKILNWLDPGHTDKAMEYTPYGMPKAHGLDDHPPGSALLLSHAFDPDPADPVHCQALVQGLKCKAPVYHECHDIPEEFVG